MRRNQSCDLIWEIQNNDSIICVQEACSSILDEGAMSLLFPFLDFLLNLHLMRGLRGGFACSGLWSPRPTTMLPSPGTAKVMSGSPPAARCRQDLPQKQQSTDVAALGTHDREKTSRRACSEKFHLKLGESTPL